MVLVRRRLDAAEPADHAVHLVVLPLGGTGGEVSALCGVRIPAAHIETVPPGEGVWCTLCFVCHVTGSPPTQGAIGSGSEPTLVVPGYRELGWPVTVRGDQISLNLDLDLDAVALVIPALLGTEVAEILTRRHCPAAVLAHPALPAHRIIIAGERFGIPLSWPAGVHRVTGTLLLWLAVSAGAAGFRSSPRRGRAGLGAPAVRAAVLPPGRRCSGHHACCLPLPLCAAGRGGR